MTGELLCDRRSGGSAAELCCNTTVDGRNPAPVEVGSSSHCLLGFIHHRWCRISAINSSSDLVDWKIYLIQFVLAAFWSTIACGSVGSKRRLHCRYHAGTGVLVKKTVGSIHSANPKRCWNIIEYPPFAALHFLLAMSKRVLFSLLCLLTRRCWIGSYRFYST